MVSPRRVGLAGIYAIEHTATGRVYIGQGAFMVQRWGTHLGALKHGAHHCSALQEAFDADGPTAFTFRFLEVIADPIERDAAEVRWIAQMAPGGLFNDRRTAGLRLTTSREPFYKMTFTRAEELRGRFHAGEGIKRLASETGMTPQNVRAIIQGKTWKTDRGNPDATFAEISRPVALTMTRVKLDAHAVQRIRQLWRQGDLTQRQIGERFDVDQQTISKVVRGTTWGWVGDDLEVA